MKWYIVATVFRIIVASEGPYDTKAECVTTMAIKIDQAKQSYAAGQRVYVQGIELSPSNVIVKCELR